MASEKKCQKCGVQLGGAWASNRRDQSESQVRKCDCEEGRHWRVAASAAAPLHFAPAAADLSLRCDPTCPESRRRPSVSETTAAESTAFATRIDTDPSLALRPTHGPSKLVAAHSFSRALQFTGKPHYCSLTRTKSFRIQRKKKKKAQLGKGHFTLSSLCLVVKNRLMGKMGATRFYV